MHTCAISSGYADTRHHAAAWQKSCRCFSSTPWSTAMMIHGTSTMTASSCPRWGAVTSMCIFFKIVMLLRIWFIYFFTLAKDCMNFGWFLLGACCSGPLLHVGWSRIPEGEWDVHFVPCWLLHGGTPNPCKPSHIPHSESSNVAQTLDSNATQKHINVSCAFQKQQFVDLATGSLGQGLGVACGMAYTGKYFDKSR